MHHHDDSRAGAAADPAPLSVAGLCARRAAGASLAFIFFWSHRPRQPGVVAEHCLSQWFPAPMVVEGVTYPTAEHFMMAEKARLFGDAATLAQILQAPQPATAKALGRQVAGFDEARWSEARFDIVLRASLAKFSQHPELRAYLLGTGARVLVEASPHDPVWGIGLSEFEDAAHDPRRWRGLNLLGFALMAARARLGAAGEGAAR